MTNGELLKQLNDRVARLEEALEKVQAELAAAKAPDKPWWEQIAGSHKDDPVFDEIVRLGAEIREKERKVARKRNAPKLQKTRAKTRATAARTHS
jgi:hypothetical protein